MGRFSKLSIVMDNPFDWVRLFRDYTDRDSDKTSDTIIGMLCIYDTKTNDAKFVELN